VLKFFAQGFAGFGHLMLVVEVLDGLLEADGDEDAEDDDEEVDEEVAAGDGGVLWWVNVDHGSSWSAAVSGY
jgi:hypothetical protein